MTVEELLQDPIFTLPKNWRDSSEPSYYHFVTRTLGQYFELVKRLEPIVIDHRTEYVGRLGVLPYAELVCKAVRQLNIGITRALQAYIDKGSPSIAMAELAKNLVLTEVEQLYAPASHLSLHILREQETLYRLRADNLPLQPREMFHIPYEKSYLVAPQRFSIAGQPCIYAASSVNLAFKEIRATSFGLTLHAVKLRVNPVSKYAPVVLVDLRNRVEEVRATYLGKPHRYDGQLIKFLVTWPLIMAASIPTEPKETFHAEYIIPHLMLEWIRSHQPENAPRLDGIAFSSSRVSLTDPDYLNAYNVVIPVHHWEKKGLCPVRTSQLLISAPVTRAMLPVALPANTPDREVTHQVQLALEPLELHELAPENEPTPAQ
ncbi:RES domain-containing protein [Hymenobacter jeollabukensis]|uniref:RES domain-containing protein n=1 Tax=Hymenobacter jeollabukensis TaxID=2025313 RepID=A0A5R8WIX0_9BACT|nr:RES domain-containing protein [Hymenobacter jeollabukensis]TLM88725.1 RES domain-containing protein [Hymenobacter jeollabukensis]